MSNQDKAKARAYFGITGQRNMVLHHIDPTLKHRDPKRYNKWFIEDLQPMTNSEHRKLHNALSGNPMDFEENRQKISKAMEKWKQIPRGTCSTMPEEDYRKMMSLRTSNRNKTMWKNSEYRDYMIEKSHESQRFAVKCVNTGKEYKSIRDATLDTGVSKYLIITSADNSIPKKGMLFEWIGVV